MHFGPAPTGYAPGPFRRAAFSSVRIRSITPPIDYSSDKLLGVSGHGYGGKPEEAKGINSNISIPNTRLLDCPIWRQSSISGDVDPRTRSNARCAMRNVALAVYSVCFIQCPSFLLHQRSMQLSKG